MRSTGLCISFNEAMDLAHNESNSWEQRFQPARFASKQLFLQSDFVQVVISYKQFEPDSEERRNFVEEKKQLVKARIDVSLIKSYVYV